MVLAASYAAGPISGGLINPAITMGADLAGAGLHPRCEQNGRKGPSKTGSRNQGAGFGNSLIYAVFQLFTTQVTLDLVCQEIHNSKRTIVVVGILTVCGSLGLVLLLQPCCSKPFPAQKEPKVRMFWKEGV